jgi:hypothetical protein
MASPEAMKAKEKLEQLTYVLKIEPPLTHDGEMLVQPAIAYAQGALVPLLTEQQINTILPVMLEFSRERVLAEAKWWRHLVIMHEESYFAVEGDKRIKQIEEQS